VKTVTWTKILEDFIMATTQPIRDKKHTRELARYFFELGQIRNYVLVVLAMHTGLRIGDILSLTWNDVYDFEKNTVRNSVTLIEKKTGKRKTIEFGNKIIKALGLYAKENAKSGCFLIENARTSNAISRVQAYRIIRRAAEVLNFAYRVSCHSLRKTFGYHAWKNGASIAIIMKIFNHTCISITERYLGITQDDMNTVYLSMELVA